MQEQMTVSEAACVAEQLYLAAKAAGRELSKKELALIVLAQRVRELNAMTGIRR